MGAQSTSILEKNIVCTFKDTIDTVIVNLCLAFPCLLNSCLLFFVFDF